MDIGTASLAVYIIGTVLMLLGLVGCAASSKYRLEKKNKANASVYLFIFLAFDLLVGLFICGAFQVATIAQQICAPPSSLEGNQESPYGRISGANMTCAKGESNAFVLALQGGRRCVQYISPAARPYQALWEDAMTTCNKRGGYSVHLYNSIDVEKVGKWIPTLAQAFPGVKSFQGWAGHRATDVKAYKSRNMAEIAWYINPTTTIGISLDLMEQQHMSWPVLAGWGGDTVQAYVGMFYVTVVGMEGRPFLFNNLIAQYVYCEYQNPEYVAEFKKYPGKRSPAPVFESHENPDVTCDQVCAKYPHCMGFNVLSIALDKYQCDLVAFIMVDLVNATLIDDKYSTYYNLVVE